MAATEEPASLTEVTLEVVVGDAPADEKPVGDAPAEEKPVVVDDHTGVDGKKPRKAKAKKVASSAPKKARSSPSHPPYIEMINEAITTLKERNGSSQYAIQKFVEEKHKNLPSNFRKLLLANLKKFVASGHLVKVKNSYKFPSARSSASKPELKPTAVSRAKAAAAKPKATASKPKAAASKSKTAAAKTKAAAAKPKAVAAKPKAKAKGKVAAAAVTKPSATRSTKRKALSDVNTKEKTKPAKAAKTNAKSTPSKKAAPAGAKALPKKATPVKKAAVKSPAKRTMPKRGKK